MQQGARPQDATETIDARLDRLPLGFFHHRLMLIVAAGLIIDAIDVAAGASAAGALLAEGFADLEALRNLAMTTSAGLAFGGLLAGALADRFGRRTLMLGSMLLVIVAGVAAALAADVFALAAWRFVAGLALGGETVLAIGYLIEMTPSRLRGRLMGWVALLASAGFPLAHALASVILPLAEGWRWLFAAPAIGGAAVLLLRLSLPESPRWLAARGEEKGADALVARLEARANVSGARPTSVESGPPGRDPKIAAPLATPGAQAGFMRRFAVAAAIQIGALIAVWGFVAWLPAFFVSEGMDMAASSRLAALMALGAPAGALVAFVVGDLFERKWMLVACAALIAVSGALYASAVNAHLILVFGFCTVCTIYLFATLGVNVYIPELFATRTRLRAVGGAASAGRAAAIAAPLLVTPLFEAGGQAAVVSVVIGFVIVAAIVVAFAGAGRSAAP